MSDENTKKPELSEISSSEDNNSETENLKDTSISESSDTEIPTESTLETEALIEEQALEEKGIAEPSKIVKAETDDSIKHTEVSENNTETEALNEEHPVNLNATVEPSENVKTENDDSVKLTEASENTLEVVPKTEVTEKVEAKVEGDVAKKVEDESEDEEDVDSSDDDDDDDAAEDVELVAQKDYHSLSPKELISELETLLKSKSIQNLKHDVDEITSEFNAQFQSELEHKKEEFLAEGGNVIDFYYSTPDKKAFNSLYFDYKEKRNDYYKNLKKDLQANFNRRNELIEELKGLWNTEENINTTYKHFKDIQENWKHAGPIPRDKYNTVWNTYHHHVENFYDFLHLNREFRDLDFKHNLDQKLKLIIRAEELTQETDVNKAFRELQMLHKMWKEEIGPVAKKYRDEVWDKFSEATKVIHDKRFDNLKALEATFEENYELKKQVIAQINEQVAVPKTSHKAWQNEMKVIQALRDKYFELGKVPRSKNKEIWSEFKEATRKFNHEKNNFYKNQKKEQYSNLEKKKELIKIAEDNKDSEDFDVVTSLMKKIQSDWRNIGHVPRKDSDKVWKKFKNACNHYFDRVHAQKNEANKEELVHYDEKKVLLESFSKFELTGDHKADVGAIKKKITEWKKIGRVPYSKKNIEQDFSKALDNAFAKLDLDKKDMELIKFENKLNTMVSQEDERKLQNEQFYISKKIEESKNEIRQLENNLGFFKHVDDSNPMVKEVHSNIARHKEQLEIWSAKLSKVRSARQD